MGCITESPRILIFLNFSFVLPVDFQPKVWLPCYLLGLAVAGWIQGLEAFHHQSKENTIWCSVHRHSNGCVHHGWDTDESPRIWSGRSMGVASTDYRLVRSALLLLDAIICLRGSLYSVSGFWFTCATGTWCYFCVRAVWNYRWGYSSTSSVKEPA